jgi:hypothetical protein
MNVHHKKCIGSPGGDGERRRAAGSRGHSIQSDCFRFCGLIKVSMLLLSQQRARDGSAASHPDMELRTVLRLLFFLTLVML